METKLFHNGQWCIGGINGREDDLLNVLNMGSVSLDHLSNFVQLGTDCVEVLVSHSHTSGLSTLVPFNGLKSIPDIAQKRPTVGFFWT